MRIKGTGTYTDANNRRYMILGVGDFSDDEKLRNLDVAGNVSFDKISCDIVKVSGKCEGSLIAAQNLDISGGISFDDISCDEADISGKCEGKSVNAKNFSVSGTSKIDSLKVEENLNLSGTPQINSVLADKILIAARDGFIGKIKCRMIKICDDNGFVAEYHSRIRIKSIDAEMVHLENCEVDVIRCKDAFIGTNCAIGKLFVTGECKVATDSTVKETVRTKSDS